MGKEKAPWYLDPENPNSGLSKGLSLCCAASISAIPPSMGDPAFHICQNCHRHADVVWVPIWKTLGRGSHRKIAYTKQIMIQTMEWIKIDRANYPPFGERVFIAQFFEEVDNGVGGDPEPLVAAGSLTHIDKDGLHFEGGDSLIINNTYRINQKLARFVPTHFCHVQKPGK
jgi:hypothetical protein